MDRLTDTNIILRLVQPAHPMHAVALNAVTKLLSDGHNLCLIPQNLIEFWNVTTRPADKNGLGRTPAQTEKDLKSLESNFTVLPESPAIYPEWRRLVVEHSVIGKQVHDTRLVAAMNVHQIDSLLTFNIGDFTRFRTISIIDPAAV